MTDVTDSAPAWVAEALTHQPSSHRVTVDGCALHYLSWNADDVDKPGLLLVHGFCAHAHWWDFVAPALVKHYRVFAMDLGGMGDSEHRERYAEPTFAREVATVIEHAEIAPATVVAHSFGGLMSIQACFGYPERFRCLVVVDSMLSFPASGVRHSDQGDVSEQKPKRIYPDIERALARFRLIPSENCAEPTVLDHVARLSLRARGEGWEWKFDDRITYTLTPAEITEAEMLRQLPCPVALIHGEHSLVMRPELAMKTATYLHRPRPPICVEGAHHHVLLDKPLALRELLLELIPALHAETFPPPNPLP